MDEEVVQYIQAWLQKAQHDLRSVEILLHCEEEDKPFDAVCFHCQQAAEKYLKAYLVFLDVDFPPTHNLARLIELGAARDPELRRLAQAEILTPYAVDLRYPEDFHLPSEEEAREAHAIALEVKNYVLARLKTVLAACW